MHLQYDACMMACFSPDKEQLYACNAVCIKISKQRISNSGAKNNGFVYSNGRQITSRSIIFFICIIACIIAKRGACGMAVKAKTI